MESASFKVPTVNVGRRQEGRERAMNIIDTPADTEAILNAWKHADSDTFRSSLLNLKNPYGDGRAAERIVKVLAQTSLDESVRIKAALTPVEMSST